MVGSHYNPTFGTCTEVAVSYIHCLLYCLIINSFGLDVFLCLWANMIVMHTWHWHQFYVYCHSARTTGAERQYNHQTRIRGSHHGKSWCGKKRKAEKQQRGAIKPQKIFCMACFLQHHYCYEQQCIKYVKRKLLILHAYCVDDGWCKL